MSEEHDAADPVPAGENPVAAEPAPEHADTAALVERWFADHFRGTAAARDTEVWNICHRAKEALKRLLQGSN